MRRIALVLTLMMMWCTGTADAEATFTSKTILALASPPSGAPSGLAANAVKVRALQPQVRVDFVIETTANSGEVSLMCYSAGIHATKWWRVGDPVTVDTSGTGHEHHRKVPGVIFSHCVLWASAGAPAPTFGTVGFLTGVAQ